MNLANLLARAGRAFGDRPAIVSGGAVYATYGELWRRASRMAAALAARYSLAPGDRVALAMKNCPEYLEAMYGAWSAGLAVVPVNAKLHPRELAYILEHSGAALCVASDELAGALSPLISALPGLKALVSTAGPEYRALLAGEPAGVAERAPGDLAWLFYTSGTTGRPKGAQLSHRNLLAMALSYFADVDAIDPGDAILHAAPMSHGSGLYHLPHLLRAAAQVIPEGGFDPAEIFSLLARHRGATLFAAPTMVKRLVEHPGGGEAPGLKTIVYGGGPMYVEDAKRALSRFGQRLVQIYGQGESPMTITALSRAHHADIGHPRYEERLASVGVAQSVVEVIVADGDDRALPPGEVGEVLVRGDVVMSGYLGDEAATARALRGGWLHTGDVRAMDEDGFLTLLDRSKDLIIRGGSNIYPREVEEVLLTHPAVREAAVVGRPDPEWGEEVVAFVVLAPGASATERDLDARCLAQIARFKRPREYRFVEALPKNNYGKVLKTELRALLSP
jgi:long-chain acyl-CoA synthetase